MDEKNKPVTSEEFNKQLREEKGLPEKEPVENKTKPITVIMIIIFILSFVAGCVIIVTAIVTVVNKINESNTTIPAGTPAPEENRIVKLSEEDIKDYEDIMKYVLRVRYDKDSFTSKDFTNQQILMYGISYAEKEDDEYTKKAINEAITKAFGNIEYKDEDIICNIDKKPLYEYNSTTETYRFTTKYSNHGHGGEGDFDRYYFFQEAERDEDKGILTVKYKIIYGIYQGDLMVPDIDLFLNAKDSIADKNKIYDMDDNSPIDDASKKKEIVDETYEKYRDEIPVTTVIYEKDSNGNYVFKSVESK